MIVDRTINFWSGLPPPPSGKYASHLGQFSPRGRRWTWNTRTLRQFSKRWTIPLAARPCRVARVQAWFNNNQRSVAVDWENLGNGEHTACVLKRFELCEISESQGEKRRSKFARNRGPKFSHLVCECEEKVHGKYTFHTSVIWISREKGGGREITSVWKIDNFSLRYYTIKLIYMNARFISLKLNWFTYILVSSHVDVLFVLHELCETIWNSRWMRK